MDDRTNNLDDENGVAIPLSTFDRRAFLRAGGAGIALAAVLAACGSDEGAGPEGITEAGTTPTTLPRPTGVVSDATLMRTATSIHYNIIDVIDSVLGLGVVRPEMVTTAEQYSELLREQADVLAEATERIGGTPFTEANPVVNDRVVQPSLHLLDVSQSQPVDAENLLQAYAQYGGETMQAFVPQLSQAELRARLMEVGAVHSRVATVMARIISPDNIVSPTDIQVAAPQDAAATTTTVETGLPSTVPGETTSTVPVGFVSDIPVYQVPSAFGSLAPIGVTLGDINQVEGPDKRAVFLIETPSLNSYMYEIAAG